MTPQTVHLIAQEIRHFKALLTVEETFWQRQPPSDVRTERFRRIDFYRAVLRDAETRLVTGKRSSE